MTISEAPPAITQGANRAQRERAKLFIRYFGKLIASAPVSLVFAGLFVVIGVVALPSVELWAAGAQATLSEEMIWTPFTAFFVSDSVPTIVLSVILTLILVVFTELHVGSKRTIHVFLWSGLITMLLGIALQAAMARMPGLEYLAYPTVADPTVAIIAVGAAGSAAATALWRRRVRMILGAVTLVFALYAGDLPAWYRLLAFSVGYAMGEIWLRRDSDNWWRSTTDERRTLVAAFIALIGIGPLASLFVGGGRGPLSVTVSSFTDFDQSMTARCAAHYMPICDSQTALLITRGIGPALLAIVPLVLLIVAAIGLRGGRRSAWWLALLTNAGLVAAGISGAVFNTTIIPGSGAEALLEATFWSITAVGLPLFSILVLLATTDVFGVRATNRAARTVGIWIGSSFALLLAVYLAAESLVRKTWSVDPSVGQLLGQGLRRFVPPGLFYDLGRMPFPRHGFGLWIWQWVGVAFWIVVVVSILWLYRKTRVVDTAGDDAYREMVKTAEGGTMAWLGTWRGAYHWFSPQGDAAVAYRVESGVAIAISDPVCQPDRRADVVAEFVEFAIHHGWTPVFYSAHDTTYEVCRDMGWQQITVAEETLIRADEWTMAGKARSKVRHPVVRMEQREGVTALWTCWADLEPQHNLQIRAISEEWVADRALPEMGFTLGSIPEMQDPDVRLMLALSAERNVIGFTSWLPSWRDGKLVSYTLDVMRRAPDAINGVMEFLIASSAQQMKDDGIEVLSMSGAPLTLTPEEAQRSPMLGAVLSQLADALEPLYGFGSLFRFKKKFQPEYHRLSLLYADPLQLPAIGMALARAYLPYASRSESMALLRGMFERTK